MIDFDKVLSKEQESICKEDKNLLVKACPGSGKTRTIIYKMAYQIEKNPNNLKKLVAITYTNRAAEEITERIENLGIDTERIWAGTIHQFCLEWVLKRYKMYTNSLNQGFKIIDERVKERYISSVVSNSGKRIYWRDIDTSYNRQLQLSEQDQVKRQLIKQYHTILKDNKELDFDLILATSYNLLKTNSFITRDINNSIELICIDEYQDTQDLQYAIIEQIANAINSSNLRINFFGDPNQAIYGSLGGIAKDLDTLNSEFTNCKFIEKTLSGCYRSTERIINFYKSFMVIPYEIEAKGKNKDENGIMIYNCLINQENIYDHVADIVQMNLEQGIEEKEICILAPMWELLYPFSNELQKRLPNVKFDAPDITPIKRDPLNIFYKMARLLLTEPNIKKLAYRRKLSKEIIDELILIYGSIFELSSMELLNIIIQSKEEKQKGSEFVKAGINNILKSLSININENSDIQKMYEDFFEKMENRLGNAKYQLTDDLHTFKKMFVEKDGVVINTCHGVKGEEYQTVIAFGLVYGKVPNINIDAMKRNEEADKLLYVIASRAKSRLYLFSERGRTYWDKGVREHVEAFPTRQLYENKNCIYDKY